MPLKDILVQLDNSQASSARLDLAISLAKTHEAFLTGLYVATPPRPQPGAHLSRSYMADVGLMSEAARRAEQNYSEQVEEVHAAADEWEQGFRRLTDHAGVASELIVAESALFDALIHYAKFCDVAMVGRSDPESERFYGRTITDQLVLSVGHAVMVIPPGKVFASLGKRIMIAWDRSPVALRAIHNARPFLRAAEEVMIVAVNIEAEYRGRAPGSGICEHLARHDIRATPQHIQVKDAKVSEALIAAAAQQNCDLLVMGAYGGSGLRERILGGVTSSILKDAPIPTLLSH